MAGALTRMGLSMDDFTNRGRAAEPLRIALLSPPMAPVPPRKYAGTERIVAALAEGLHERGHAVTLFAPAIPMFDASSCRRSRTASGRSAIRRSLALHQHDPRPGLVDARPVRCHPLSRRDPGLPVRPDVPTPVVSTAHGRLDGPAVAATLADFTDVPLVAISANQRRWFPEANWVGTVHHGLDLATRPSRPQRASTSRS